MIDLTKLVRIVRTVDALITSVRSLDKAIRHASNNPEREPDPLPEGYEGWWEDLIAEKDDK